MIQLKVKRIWHDRWEVTGTDIANITGRGESIQDCLGEYSKLFTILTKMPLVNYKWS